MIQLWNALATLASSQMFSQYSTVSLIGEFCEIFRVYSVTIQGNRSVYQFKVINTRIKMQNDAKSTVLFHI